MLCFADSQMIKASSSNWGWLLCATQSAVQGACSVLKAFSTSSLNWSLDQSHSQVLTSRLLQAWCEVTHPAVDQQSGTNHSRSHTTSQQPSNWLSRWPCHQADNQQLSALMSTPARLGLNHLLIGAAFTAAASSPTVLRPLRKPPNSLLSVRIAANLCFYLSCNHSRAPY